MEAKKKRVAKIVENESHWVQIIVKIVEPASLV